MTSQPVPPILVEMVAAAIGGLFAVWAIQKRLIRKRTDELRTESLGLGLNFEGDEWADRRRAAQLDTALFAKGNNRQFKNVMTGSRNRLNLSLFDYSFTVGSGRSARTYRQTVGAFSKPDVYLPYFELRPSGAADRIWDAVAHKNIHFESDPEFSRRYVLRGALDDKVQSLFTPPLLSFLESLDPQKKWRLEGAGDTLILYRYDKRTRPSELRTFLDEASSIASSFFTLVPAPLATPR